ncbi:alcohol dehydrogenase catalytic domain-containing protein [Nonomuraea sp. NPDC049141]|uniref:alcohol dehydrogenase catalytic domain-containing protein n=1 Tax=Nonomuraea sp. NPDC049141 TaxID=3155500 RepID=UPI0034010CB9
MVVLLRSLGVSNQSHTPGTCVCGSDLHRYHSLPASAQGTPMGHEFLGVIEDFGSQVSGLKRGDLVVAPFAFPTTRATSAGRVCIHLLPQRRLLGYRRRRRRPGQGDPSPAGLGHPGEAARRRGLGVAAVPTDASRRVRHQPPRRRAGPRRRAYQALQASTCWPLRLASRIGEVSRRQPRRPSPVP